MSNLKGKWNGSDTYDNKPHGQGTFKSINGDTYKGRFDYGQLTGHGEIKYSDGSSFSGDFSSGNANGHGTYRDQFGNEVSGYFENGVLIETDAQRERNIQAAHEMKLFVQNKLREQDIAFYEKVIEECKKREAIVDQNRKEFYRLKKTNPFKIYKDNNDATYYIGKTKNGIPYGFGKLYFLDFCKTLTGIFINDGVFGITTYVISGEKTMTKLCFDYKYVEPFDYGIIRSLPGGVLGFSDEEICSSIDLDNEFYPDDKYEKHVIKHASYVLSIRDELFKYHKISERPDFFKIRRAMYEKKDNSDVEKYLRRYIKLYYRGAVIEGPVKRKGPFTIIKIDGTIITGSLNGGWSGIISNYKEENIFGEIKTSTKETFDQIIAKIDKEENKYFYKYKKRYFEW